MLLSFACHHWWGPGLVGGTRAWRCLRAPAYSACPARKPLTGSRQIECPFFFLVAVQSCAPLHFHALVTVTSVKRQPGPAPAASSESVWGHGSLRKTEGPITQTDMATSSSCVVVSAVSKTSTLLYWRPSAKANAAPAERESLLRRDSSLRVVQRLQLVP